MNWKAIVAGAISGFVAALMVDLNSWSKSTPKGQKNLEYDWSLALKRWIAGGMAGGAAAAGWNVVITE